MAKIFSKIIDFRQPNVCWHNLLLEISAPREFMSSTQLLMVRYGIILSRGCHILLESFLIYHCRSKTIWRGFNLHWISFYGHWKQFVKKKNILCDKKYLEKSNIHKKYTEKNAYVFVYIEIFLFLLQNVIPFKV